MVAWQSTADSSKADSFETCQLTKDNNAHQTPPKVFQASIVIKIDTT
jgi:hypothetical protein